MRLIFHQLIFICILVICFNVLAVTVASESMLAKFGLLNYLPADTYSILNKSKGEK